MGYIVLSKKQIAGNNINGSLNVKLCKDRASANLQRKQLFKQNYDVVILDEDDYNKLGEKVFRHRISNINRRNNGGDNTDPIWNGPSEDLLVNSSDEHTNSDKTNDVFSIMEFGDKYFGGDEEAHKAWDKEGEGKVIEETFINSFGVEQVDLGPKRFYVDKDGDEYYLSSNGNHYYLFKKVVTLKGDREQTIYMFGKKEWSKTNDLTLLRFYNIPYDKVVVENSSGYPFLKTDVHNDHDKHLRDRNKNEII